jgi:predicted DNA-binding transcriptional regulator AlpA
MKRSNESASKTRLLRLKEVLRLTGLSKSTWYTGIKSGRYPRGVKLGPRIRAWPEHAILTLVEQGIDEADA